MDKRTAIITSALELIAEHGFHGAPMSLVAKRAGVATGTIYRYFESKDDLISAIYREIEERLVEVIAQDYPHKAHIRERFIHLGTQLLRYFTKHPIHFRYLEQYHNSPYGASLRKDKIFDKKREEDLFRGLLREGIEQGVLKDLPVYIHFALAFGPLTSLARDHVLGLVSLDEDLMERSVAASWDAMKR
ncbi:MAG: TetR/AcrR family transcriptional regulator [Syntrophales bacterium]|nr:TetR/AcrR family transcriptional regulator [Syntrophales bacterium]